MGLDACVRCNCIQEGRAARHPLPELLRFDGDGEPYLASEEGISESQWAMHDQWCKAACPHADGYIVSKRLGNISSIAHVRAFIELMAPTRFPMLHERVVYSGTHCGDSISPGDAAILAKETRLLLESASDPCVKEFAVDVIELAEASVATENPIIF